MPVMNGIKATKKIRKFEKEKNLKKTPVMAITGNDTKFDRQKALEIGFDDFLSKPLDKDIIL